MKFIITIKEMEDLSADGYPIKRYCPIWKPHYRLGFINAATSYRYFSDPMGDQINFYDIKLCIDFCNSVKDPRTYVKCIGSNIPYLRIDEV